MSQRDALARTIDATTAGTVPARRPRIPTTRQGVELRGTPVPPTQVEVQLFVEDVAAIVRRLMHKGE